MKIGLKGNAWSNLQGEVNYRWVPIINLWNTRSAAGATNGLLIMSPSYCFYHVEEQPFYNIVVGFGTLSNTTQAHKN